MNKLVTIKTFVYILTILGTIGAWAELQAGPFSGPSCVYYHDLSNVEFGRTAAPKGVNSDEGCQALPVPLHSHLGGKDPRSVIIVPLPYNQVDDGNEIDTEIEHEHGHGHMHAHKKDKIDSKFIKTPIYEIMSSHSGKYENDDDK